MTPERVRMLILNGHTGGTLYECIHTLIYGFLKQGHIDNAVTLFELFIERVDGLYDSSEERIIGIKEILNHVLEQARDSQLHDSNVRAFYQQIGTLGDDIIEAYSEIHLAYLTEINPSNILKLIKIAANHCLGHELFDFMWKAKDYADTEVLRKYWETFDSYYE